MIRIGKIRIEGFGSFLEPFFYRWDSSGINLIKGKNGSGKSTLISALCWVIYGKSLKGGITPWTQDNKYKGTKVIIKLRRDDQEVMIIRCKDYKGQIEGEKGKSKIFLYIDGKYMKKYRDKDHCQNAIDRIMGMTFTVFKNSIVFGQKMTRLLKESGPKQKELFEEAFDQTYISAARDKAIKDRESLEILLDRELIKLEGEIMTLRHILDRIKEAEEYEKEKLGDIWELEERIKEGKEDYRKLKKANKLYLELRGKLDNLKAVEDLEFKKDFQLSQLKGEREGITNDLKKLMLKKSNLDRKCTYCEQPLDKTHIEVHNKNVEKRKKELTNKGIDLNLEINSLQKSVDKLQREIKTLQTMTREVKIVTIESVTSKKLYVDQLIKSLRDTKAKSKASKIESLKAEASNQNSLINSIETSNEELSLKIKNLSWLTDFALSNKGLKNYIFNSLLTDVNLELSRYRGLLGFQVLFRVDLESKSKSFEAIIQKKDKQIGYDDLSGGQQQLVDIALAFSLHEVFSKTSNINILALDEVFESLDPENVELISEIIQVKARNRSVHLVTHLDSFTAPSVRNVVKFQLQRGITTVVH